MVSNALKLFPLAILLALPAAPSAGDDPPEKEKKIEKRIVVTDDGVFSSDGDDMVVRGLRHLRQGYLGVRLLEMTPELREHFGAPKNEGVLVASVESDSPAAKGGIRVGDIITRADGERIESGADLTRAVRRLRSGDTLKVDVSRDRANRQIAVKIEERRGSELDLGELGRSLGRHAWVFRDHPENLDRLQQRLEEIEKRLKDLEKKLPAR
ncbi:MAG TPA: PDZ domain-containing protein [Thermoanaerobaculia bacterium]|nr:PDZ domain-containing protein [Thermoanaerobaculia bacterium]